MSPAVFNTGLEQDLNLVGTFVFAISGALMAAHKRYDIVGMTVLAEMTAIGGGVIRDLILGATPPAAFTDHATLLLPLGAVALVFVLSRFIIQRPDHTTIRSKDQRRPALVLRYRTQIQAAVLVFDAAGLAVFCIAGTAKALAYGLGPVEAIALGTLTGVGGGILRDILANEQPTVLRAESELYAVPAVCGAALIVLCQHLHRYNSLTAGIAAVFVFVLRMLALRYDWHAPRPRAYCDTGDDVLEDA